MKIKISKTELNALPHVVWNKFCYFALENQEHEDRYTPMQKTATMCLWYHAEVCGEGHLGYFDNWEKVDKNELAEALRTIGVPGFADNLMEALKCGHEDDYIKTDTWFGENEKTLLKALETYLHDHVSEFYEIVDEDYTMRQPKFVFWVGLVDVVFFVACMALMLIAGTDENIPLLIAGFSAFASLGVILIIYAKMWKVIVKKDAVTAYMPFRQPREIRLDEISKVRHTLQGLIVYVDGKRALAVDNIVNDYEMFYAQLHEAGKMESTQCSNGFVIRQHKGNMIGGVIGILFFGAILIWIFFWPNDSVNAFAYIVFSGFVLLSLWLIVQYLFWRITIADDTIIVRGTFGSENRYRIQNITKAQMGKENLVLYVGDQKIAKVAYGCSGYAILAERLENEGIPLIYKQKK